MPLDTRDATPIPVCLNSPWTVRNLGKSFDCAAYFLGASLKTTYVVPLCEAHVVPMLGPIQEASWWWFGALWGV